MTRAIVGLTVVAALGGMGIGGGSAQAQDACHPAYSGCLPIVDELNCDDIGYAVVQVWDVSNDPYGLDVLYGPGNGWTCDGIG